MISAQLNYYEMLDIKPDANSSGNSQRLQFRIADLSIRFSASYSFFRRKKRKEIITLWEKAYFTLIK